MALAAIALQAHGQPDHQHHAGHAMTRDATGMTMNHNYDRLPRDCPELAGEVKFEIRAGRAWAQPYPGLMFGFDQNDLEVAPCTRVVVTLVNEDSVRHQWMVHGLPRYLYPGGMFHLETAGGTSRTAAFIVPSDRRTYLVHCDMAQHMEMGMKAQLRVGGGDGSLWSVPGVSGSFDTRQQQRPGLVASAVFLLVLLGGTMWFRHQGERT